MVSTVSGAAIATVNKGTFIYLQSLGKTLVYTIISMTHEIVFGVGSVLLLAKYA